MLIVLTNEQAAVIRDRQRAHVAKTLRETLELYPGTKSAALIRFLREAGTDFALLDDEDFHELLVFELIQ